MTQKIKKLLIANRSEIACRIIKTAKLMNIETVAIYSDIDADSLFVRNADIAVPLNGIVGKDTYLNQEKIINIAKKYKVDAIHPGYGFLSENSDFVAKLEKENINFVGPSAFSIDAMGNKLKAKNLAAKSKVNIVPGFVGAIKNEKHAIDICEKIGYPIIIKAVFGGGGKGMKIAYNQTDVFDAITSAQNEARNNFGNEDVFIEKYIEEPHHIEIQVVADKHGNVVCLGERDCSIQRFNQKIIEESPSLFINQQIREQMYEQSVSLVRESKYHSVGTIEYIVDKNKNFYFLEMNTRLQVEHGVTEFVTKLDLVKLMIDIAENKKLPFKQKDIKLNGHAIECRICAENPSKMFIPSIGKINHYFEPNKSYNVRVDTGIVSGSEISSYYDSMIAKLITFGDTRNEAINLMKKSLGDFEIDGVETNIEMLEAIMRNDKFVKGEFSTAFIKENYPKGFKYIELNDNIKKGFLIAATTIYLAEQKKYFSHNNYCTIPTNVEYYKLHITFQGKSNEPHEYVVTIFEYDDTFIELHYHSEIIKLKHSFKFGNTSIKGVMNGIVDVNIKIKYLNDGYIFNSSGSQEKIVVRSSYIIEYNKYISYNNISKKKDNKIVAQLTGKLVKLKVNVGDEVDEGFHLLSIEAMKMENMILSENKCKIIKILKQEGDMVFKGDLLMEIE